MTLARIEHITIYDAPATAVAWRRGAAGRASHLAAATSRMLDLAQIAPGHRVLVVGTGTGEEALDAAALVGTSGEVVATDVSAAMIAEASRSVDAAKATNIRCQVMDAQNLELAQNAFDAVISRNALMYIPDVSLALAEINRVLKFGGRIAVTTWASARRNPRLFDPLEAARALGAKPPPTANNRIALRLGSPSLLAAALREACFSNVVVERSPVVARYGTLDDAVQQAMDDAGTRELIKLLPGDSAERMRRWLEQRWKKYALLGEVNLHGEQLLAAGTKSD